MLISSELNKTGWFHSLLVELVPVLNLRAEESAFPIGSGYVSTLLEDFQALLKRCEDGFPIRVLL